jgi:hypothetical protein
VRNGGENRDRENNSSKRLGRNRMKVLSVKENRLWVENGNFWRRFLKEKPKVKGKWMADICMIRENFC